MVNRLTGRAFCPILSHPRVPGPSSSSGVCKRVSSLDPLRSSQSNPNLEKNSIHPRVGAALHMLEALIYPLAFQ